MQAHPRIHDHMLATIGLETEPGLVKKQMFMTFCSLNDNGSSALKKKYLVFSGTLFSKSIFVTESTMLFESA